MSNTVDKVIEIAMAEDGYLEKSKEAYKKDKNVLDSKDEGAGSDNYTKYEREMHELCPSIPFPSAWCDCFTDWCFYKAYGEVGAKALLAGSFSAYTVKSAQLYKDKNAWFTSDPQPGDQIFFKDSKGGICHTGLVIKVAEGYVHTIEGNTSSARGVVENGGCVRKKSYGLTYTRIAGYGRPQYDVDSVLPATQETVKYDPWENLIIELQKALNAEYDAGLVVDGKVGPKTFQATPTLNARMRDKKPKTVKALQNLLSYWGYKCNADGDFYNATEKMVKSFQREKVGMVNPDGEVWAQKKSWKVLLKLK